MPRRSSFSKSSTRPSNNRSTTFASAPVKSPSMTKPQTQQKPGFLGQMAGVMMEGMAFGAGSEIAHSAIRGLMGGNNTMQQQVVNQTQPETLNNSSNQNCQNFQSSFTHCLANSNNDLKLCQNEFDSMNQCYDRFK